MDREQTHNKRLWTVLVAAIAVSMSGKDSGGDTKEEVLQEGIRMASAAVALALIRRLLAGR